MHLYTKLSCCSKTKVIGQSSQSQRERRAQAATAAMADRGVAKVENLSENKQ